MTEFLISIPYLGFTRQKLFWRFNTFIGMELYIGKQLGFRCQVKPKTFPAPSFPVLIGLFPNIDWQISYFGLSHVVHKMDDSKRFFGFSTCQNKSVWIFQQGFKIG